ncbi:hypothetical protein CZ674_08560 [Agrococcus casei LMG 22410]|uniref:Uncharacterized protein n=1 Tax=Agrococcus casei LMG 22410 TaxID=1255656 RepID=A0A1R4G3R8_9MICO|nr:hypothetical protein CZ674_08560 [Agrococcus casei LMG 22410]
MHPSEEAAAEPAPSDEGQQPFRVTVVVLLDVPSSSCPVGENTVDLLPFFDRDDRRPVGLTDHLTLVLAQARDRGAPDDLHEGRIHPAARLVTQRFHRCWDVLTVQTRDDPVHRYSVKNLIDCCRDDRSLLRVDFLSQQSARVFVVHPAVAVGESSVWPTLLRVQPDRAKLPLPDNRRVLLRSQELESHHEGVVTAREVIHPTLGQVENTRCLTRSAELNVSREFASGTRRLPGHKGCILLGCDELQGLLKAFTLPSAPLRCGAVCIGNDSGDPPPLLLAPGTAVRLLVTRGPHQIVTIHRGAGIDQRVGP